MTIFSRIKSIFSKDIQKKNQSLDDDLDNGPDYLNEEKNSLVTSRLKSKRNDFKPQAKDDNGFDWFADRYETLIVQRNISVFLLIIAILCIGLTGISLAVITKNKTIEPFVIEIEKKQGIVTYVNNNSKVQEYTQNEVLRNYFIKQYIEARETFDPVNYNYYYYKIVKAMSNEMTYRQFLYTLRSNGKDNPMVLFANNEASMINIVSISILKEKVLQVRFVAEGRFADGKSIRANKIAVIEYDFLNLEMNEERRYINPLGFIVNSYRSTDENV
jgi:type IV secretion system protein VirB8